jgi:hypothetical protein
MSIVTIIGLQISPKDMDNTVQLSNSEADP